MDVGSLVLKRVDAGSLVLNRVGISDPKSEGSLVAKSVEAGVSVDAANGGTSLVLNRDGAVSGLALGPLRNARASSIEKF